MLACNMLFVYLISIYFLLYFVTTILLFFYFFFNDTATTEIYTLSLHDALPICRGRVVHARPRFLSDQGAHHFRWRRRIDRKSTRLNSSHPSISYAVFCLKKKNKNIYAFLFYSFHIQYTLLFFYIALFLNVIYY